jgi:hypothetical protein
MPTGNVNAVGSAIQAAVASSNLAAGMAQGIAGGISAAMGPPSSSSAGAVPGAGVDPSALAGMQGQGAKADSDPIDSFFDDMFGDDSDSSPAAGADSSFLGADGGGPMPGASGVEGLPVAAGPDGQAMLMTSQGALPLAMSQQGPVAITPDGGAVPLQALAQSGAGSPGATQAQAQSQAMAQIQARQAQAQALSQLVASRRQALASPAPTPFSGTSAFVPARRAPVALTAPTVQAAPTAAGHNRPVADPKLDEKAGIGTRIGTTGTGDGNIR